MGAIPPPTFPGQRDRESTPLKSSHRPKSYSRFFFLNDRATTEISPLPLHAALRISAPPPKKQSPTWPVFLPCAVRAAPGAGAIAAEMMPDAPEKWRVGSAKCMEPIQPATFPGH